MATRKLSGAELARQLTGLAPPAVAVPGASVEPPEVPQEFEAPSPSPSSAAPEASVAITGAPARAPQTAKGKSGSAANSRGGRPAKAGVDGMPVNVRLSQADHLALAKLAVKLVVPGRPMPTVQDVVRGIIRGALREPDLVTRFCRQQDN